MAFTVYDHTNKINGKKYVGVTQKKPEKRWRNGKGYERQYFYNAILKYGWENFEHTILKTGMTQEEANYYEKYYIKEFDSLLGHNGYNAAIGGYDAGMTGLHHSEETKKKMSVARRGKTLSLEHRKKLSEVRKGKTFSEEHKRNLGNARRGKRHTEETKARIRSLMYGENSPCAKEVFQYTKDGIFVKRWGCISDASRELKIDCSGISKCCKGARKTRGGYIWTYEYRGEKIADL